MIMNKQSGVSNIIYGLLVIAILSSAIFGLTRLESTFDTKLSDINTELASVSPSISSDPAISLGATATATSYCTSINCTDPNFPTGELSSFTLVNDLCANLVDLTNYIDFTSTGSGAGTAISYNATENSITFTIEQDQSNTKIIFGETEVTPNYTERTTWIVETGGGSGSWCLYWPT